VSIDVNRISISNLRSTSKDQLGVLIQDALPMPLGQLETSTLLDLLALSEVTDQLHPEQAKDLAEFRTRILSQITDLPEGKILNEFIQGIDETTHNQIPSCLRELIGAHSSVVVDPDSVEALTALHTKLGESEAQAIQLPVEDAKSAKAKATEKPKKKRRSLTRVDDVRAAWIEEDVLSRLTKPENTTRGLKESIIVAGSRYRGRVTYPDLTDAQVLAVMRRMKREEKLRFSRGRWFVER